MANDQGKNEYSYCGLTLKRTGVISLEQYEVYYENNLCGYMRFRNGSFRAEYIIPGRMDEYVPIFHPYRYREKVYFSYPRGDNMFYNEDERMYHLNEGSEKIVEAMKKNENKNNYYGLTLEKTSYACPEQYSVYDGDTLCGYMRLRHGVFIVDYYEVIDGSSERVYESETKGDGIFYDEEEREYHLKNGAEKIYERLGKSDVQ